MTKTRAKTKAPEPPKAKPPETKLQRVITLLRREGGATLDEVVEATRWQPHSARAVFTGLRKKGFTLMRTRSDGVTRYAFTAEPAA